MTTVALGGRRRLRLPIPRAKLPRPRWQTPLPPGVVGSWGPDVEAWALAELGIQLDVWQRRALNRALAFDRDRRLVHRIYLVSVGRQNGKTASSRSVVGWALTAPAIPEWTRILGLAHDRAQARIPYEAVLEDLEPIRRRFPRGGLHLTRYLGIRSDLFGIHREYHTGSREARNAVRSSSNDLALFDEIRTQSSYATWSALEPTTRARPDPLILGLSTAGDDRSLLLRDWWERGIRIIEGAEPADGFGMTWYAADDELAPDDPLAVVQANPAVAEGRVPLRAVAASIRTLDAVSYRQETLNLWSAGGDEWLPPGTWRARIGPAPSSAIRILFGVEATPTWSRATVIAAALTDAGVYVSVAGELDAATTSSSSIAPDDLVELLRRLAPAWQPAAIAYSVSATAARHVLAWAESTPSGAKVVALPMTPRQIRAGSQLFRSELIGGRVTHPDDALLAQQVRAGRPTGELDGDDWFFGIRESAPAEIDALRAMAWATWAAIAPEARIVAPQIFL